MRKKSVPHVGISLLLAFVFFATMLPMSALADSSEQSSIALAGQEASSALENAVQQTGPAAYGTEEESAPSTDEILKELDDDEQPLVTQATPQVPVVQQAGAPFSPLSNASLTARWEKAGGTAASMPVGDSDVALITIQGDTQAPASSGYKLVIELQNPDDAVPDTGFSIAASGYTSAANQILHVERSSDGAALTYTLAPDIGTLTVNIPIQSRASAVYHEEVVEITATLFKDDDTQAAAKTTVTAQTHFGQVREFLFSQYTSAEIPAGQASTVYSFYSGRSFINFTESGHNTLTSGRLASLKLDFSGLEITVEGVTLPYSGWLTSYGDYGYAEPPVTILQGDRSALAQDFYLSLNGGPESIYDAFIIETTSDFTVGSTIALKTISIVDLLVQINGRGPQVTPVFFESQAEAEASGEVFVNYMWENSIKTLTAVEQKLSPALYRAVGNTREHIVYNTQQYENVADGVDSLYYQELFRLGFTNTYSTPQDVTVEVKIPDNMLVTHIRLPRLTDNYTAYTSVKYKGTNYYPEDTIEIQNPIAGGIITLEVTGLALMLPKAAANAAYDRTHLIQFCGTTNSAVSPGASINLEAFITQGPDNNTGGKRASLLLGVVDLPILDGYTLNQYYLRASAANTASIGSIEVGNSLQMFASVQPSVYPYDSAIFYKDAKSVPGTLLVPNPVFYFSVPAGLELQAGNPVYMSAAADYYGNNLQYTLTEYQNEGYFAAEGGRLVEVKVCSADSSNVWINKALTVALNLHVPYNYLMSSEGSIISFPKETVLIGSWSDNISSFKSGTNSYGINYDLSAIVSDTTLNSLALTGTNTIYSTYVTAVDFVVTETSAAGAAIKVQIEGGALASYNSAKETDYAQHYLDDEANAIQFTLYNTIPAEDYAIQNANVYYILPTGSGWRTSFATPLTVNSGSLSYTLYYTTDEASTLGYNPDGTVTGASLTWIAVTDLLDPAIPWQDITALCFTFSELPQATSLTANASYVLATSGSTVAYNTIEAGQTLYYFGSDFYRTAGYTAAAKLLKSEPPVILGAEDLVLHDEHGAPLAQTIKQGVDEAPNWWSGTVTDDYSDVALESVAILYTPSDGSQSTTTTLSSFNHNGNKFTILDENGTAMDAQSAKTYIDTRRREGVVGGAYRITYTSTPDADGQRAVETRKLYVQDSYTVTYSAGVPEGQFTGTVPTDSALYAENENAFVLDPANSALARAGYTFRHWYDYTDEAITYTPGEAIAFSGEKLRDHILVAAWDANKYTITYHANNGTGDTKDDTALHSSPYTLLDNSFANEGYTPQGWATTEQRANEGITDYQAGYTFDAYTLGNINLYAVWEHIELTVSFNTHGGNNIDPQTVLYGNTATRPAQDSEKEGYTFAGWYTDADYTAEFDFATAIKQDTTVHAKWEQKELTVSFNTHGGTAIAQQTVLYGNAATCPAQDPEKEGYTFAGWYTDADYNTEFDFTAAIKQDTTVHSKWEQKELTVSFDTHGGNDIDPQIVLFGNTATRPAQDPEKEGYTFAGWYTDADYTAEFDFSTAIKQDTTVHAKWEQKELTVSFNTHGGNNIDPQIVLYGNNATRPAQDSEKEGYTFAGWYTDADYTAEFDFATAIKQDTTVHAKWEQKELTVSFNTHGGNNIDPQTVLYGNSATRPAQDPEKEGYTFAGWYTDADYTAEFDFTTAIKQDTTIHAKWHETATQYTVTYDYNDGTGTKLSLAYFAGARIENPGNPERSGYTFLGWQPDGKEYSGYWNFATQLMPARDLVLTAKWQKLDSTDSSSSKPDSSSSEPNSSSSQPNSSSSQPIGSVTTSGGDASQPESNTTTSAPSSSSTARNSSSSSSSGSSSFNASSQVSSAITESHTPPDESIDSDASQGQPETRYSYSDPIDTRPGSPDYIQDNGAVSLFGSDIPLGGFASVGGWGLVNLLLSIISLLGGALLVARMLLVRKKNTEREEDTNEEMADLEYPDSGYNEKPLRRAKLLGWLAGIFGILPILLFFILENLTRMIIINRLTPLFLFVFILHLCIAILSLIATRKHKQEEPAANE